MGVLALAPLEIRDLIRTRALKALESFLRDKLDYDLYREHFVDELTTTLQDNPAEDQAEEIAKTLAHECARNDADAVDKVNAILAGIDLNINHILNRAKTRKAKELTQQYVRRDPDAVKLIDEHSPRLA